MLNFQIDLNEVRSARLLKTLLLAREVWDLIPGPAKSVTVPNSSQPLAAAMFLRSCVVHVLSRGEGPGLSLHAST